MAYKIIINPSSGLDIIEAIEWYNEHLSNLGFRFYISAQATLNNIMGNPTGFAVRYKTIRTAIIKKFPYMVHYIVDQQTETISVLAVLCMNRNHFVLS